MREVPLRRRELTRPGLAGRAPRTVAVRETDEELTTRVAREVRRSLLTAVVVAAVAVAMGAMLR